MERYKIALISDWYFPKVGGIEYCMHSLAKTLIQEGHEVHIITRSYPDIPQYSTRERIKIIRVGSSLLPGQQRFMMPEAYKELYDLLKSEKYNILTLTGWTLLSVWLPCLCPENSEFLL